MLLPSPAIFTVLHSSDSYHGAYLAPRLTNREHHSNTDSVQGSLGCDLKRTATGKRRELVEAGQRLVQYYIRI